MIDTSAEKPEPPEPWECCGGGSCNPCVWDRYYEELRLWNQSQGTLSLTHPSPPGDDPKERYR